MIHVDRSAVEVTPILRSPLVEKELKAAEKLFNPSLLAAKIGNYAFKAQTFSHREVRDALYQLFHNKCAYCESKISATGTDDLEHFRPKTRAMNLGGEMSIKHYWWLAYEWENLYISCQLCNHKHPAQG